MEYDPMNAPSFVFMDWFYNGGIFMYYIILANIISALLLVATFTRCTPERKNMTVKIFAVIVLVPLLVGIMGHYLGYVQTMQAVTHANPLEKEELYQASMAVAVIPTLFGAVSSLFLFLLGLVGFRLCKKAT